MTLILKPKNESAMARFFFITKAFVSIKIPPHFVMLIPTLRGKNHTNNSHIAKNTLSETPQFLNSLFANHNPQH